MGLLAMTKKIKLSALKKFANLFSLKVAQFFKGIKILER